MIQKVPEENGWLREEATRASGYWICPEKGREACPSSAYCGLADPCSPSGGASTDYGAYTEEIVVVEEKPQRHVGDVSE